MEKERGLYLPVIDENCVHCGLCLRACPGKGIIENDDNLIVEDLSIKDLIGSCLKSVNGWSKNPEIRHNSASGGVTTTIICSLLRKGIYDTAFVVDSFDYSEQIKTKRFTDTDRLIDFSDDEKSTTKSRYVPVSHTDAIRYMINHPMERLIIIGTPCAIRGILNVIELKRLNRERYLLIGLFCESVMNYDIWNYFSQKNFTGQKTLAALHFKNKESGGWPGNLKLLYSDGTYEYYNKRFRMEIKRFFKPERCIYCVDKLNVNADVSLGDNYTGVDDSNLGSNTVIVRTERGMNAFENSASDLEIRDIDIEKIIIAQGLKERAKNIEFAGYKQKKIETDSRIRLDINSMKRKGKGTIRMSEYKNVMNHINFLGGDYSLLNCILSVCHTKAKVKYIVKRLLRL